MNAYLGPVMGIGNRLHTSIDNLAPSPLDPCMQQFCDAMYSLAIRNRRLVSYNICYMRRFKETILQWQTPTSTKLQGCMYQ